MIVYSLQGVTINTALESGSTDLRDVCKESRSLVCSTKKDREIGPIERTCRGEKTIVVKRPRVFN